MVSEVASWFDMPLVHDAPVTPADLYAADRFSTGNAERYSPAMRASDIRIQWPMANSSWSMVTSTGLR
jgi:hypothetical protein